MNRTVWGTIGLVVLLLLVWWLWPRSVSQVSIVGSTPVATATPCPGRGPCAGPTTEPITDRELLIKIHTQNQISEKDLDAFKKRVEEQANALAAAKSAQDKAEWVLLHSEPLLQAQANYLQRRLDQAVEERKEERKQELDHRQVERTTQILGAPDCSKVRPCTTPRADPCAGLEGADLKTCRSLQ